jgi:shikimate dehydrogenase
MPDQSSRYAVFGHPVAHSLSPAIQRAFAAQFGGDIDYAAIDAAPEAFADDVRAFFAAGGAGANVTVPHKRGACELADERSAAVERAGVANVLTRLADGRLRADNTDGSGLLRDLAERRRFDLRERRVLLLGAGGAARGVAFPLCDAGVAELVIVNRTSAAAAALADRLGPQASSHEWSWLEEIGRFDLVLNATAAGVRGEALVLPASLVGDETLCYDLSYGAAAQPFLAWAREARAGDVVDGFGMLLETAADSYAIWFGRRPDTAPVFQALRTD